LTAEGDRLRANAPKGVLTEDLRSQIAARKAEIVAALQTAATFSPPPISRRSSTDPAPVSFAQERLWFLEQLEPDRGVYNICRAFRLTGDLNVPTLDASLSEIVRRHEVLRSAFQVIDGRPLQVTLPAPKVTLSLIDLSGADREEEVQRRIKEEAARPCDLSAGLFLRGSLLRVGDDEHILILTTHHIVSDAWSMGILTRELWSLYKAYAAGKPMTLKDLPIQYADFAIWQREWLRGQMLESQLSYWKKQLHDIPILNLPTDRTRTARPSFSGARRSITLSLSLTTAINELSHRQNVTPFMTLLAAFQVLLHRYSGQDDVVVGSPIANRRRTEFESLIGFFVNTLVLRSNLSGDPTFQELLGRVREACLDAYAHQDLPFEKLVQELQPERDQSRNPLFQVMFVLQNATRPFAGTAGLRIEPIEFEMTRSLFDLSLFLRERGGTFIGYFEYVTDLFERETIERMTGHFETLLEGIVAAPDQPISTLPILTKAERHQILVEWNDTAADYPKDRCIHELFEAQVERTPEAIALEFEASEITYRELNRRANQLAHSLISLGIGPEKLVGICVERSIEMVVGLLGILKAGGAYVPLDPSYPKERLCFMLEDAQVAVLLTQEKLVEDKGWKPVPSSSAPLRLNSVEGMEDGDPQSSILDPRFTVVCLDRDLPLIAPSDDNPKSCIDSENLSYVIYTSGSTGTPKGVAIEHRNTVALLHWAKEVFTADEIAGVLASTSICFDLSVFELFVPLSWGGKIILVENALSLREAADKGITLVNTVPSAMATLLGAGALPESVRVVNLAGEPLCRELVNQLYQTGMIEKVYDLYGPSETATYSTFTRRTANGLATIGRPIANTHVYLLDLRMQPVPVGVPGELYIGGAGVARGYLNRPELTAEKFISDPFSNDASSRLYRTGDLARYLGDGNIEFLGRLDNQIKIRGFRIESGEIESVLNQHPAVRESVVIASSFPPSRRGKIEVGVTFPTNGKAEEAPLFLRSPVEGEGVSDADRNLIAYLVLNAEKPLEGELRCFLKEKLPDYMVPSLFIFLNALPLSPNGKVDRSKLPSPHESSRDLTSVPIAPRSELEELVANIWRDVLQIENLSVHDNFFALGGHSLLAIQVVSRLQKSFNKEVPMRILFDAPTIAAFADGLENVLREGKAPSLPPIVPVSRDGALPLSMNQEHIWRMEQMVPGTHFFNMPYVYQLTGDLKTEALERALLELARRHEALRTVFTEVAGSPVQIIREAPDREAPDVRLSYIELRAGSADEIFPKAADWILKERRDPFDLESGPLMRLRLLRLMDSNYLLLVTIHHIVSDHWSMQIFRNELNILYSVFLRGQSSPLPEPTIQFADYAFLERKLIEEGALDTQRKFWERKLADRGALGLPVHKRIRKTAAFLREHQSLDLDGPLFEELKSFVARRNLTPFTVMLSTLYALMHLCTGQRDLKIGVLVANRRWRGAESVIGHFVNTVVLPIHVSVGMTFEDLLDLTREVVVTIHGNQEYPFEALARAIETESNLERATLFQVLLAYNVANSAVCPTGPSFAPLYLRDAQLEENITLTAFDIIFSFSESSTELSGSVNYRKGLLRGNSRDSVNEYLGSLVETILFRTSTPISRTIFADLPEHIFRKRRRTYEPKL
jgi:amino acid adenylation domain-containing protein